MYGLCLRYVVSNPAIKSPHTERLLTGAVKKFGLYLQRPPEVGDFSDANLVGFVKWRRTAGMAEATVEREANKLLTLWRSRLLSLGGLVNGLPHLYTRS